MGNVFKTFKIRGGAIARLQIAIVLLACIITGNKVYAADVYEFNYTGNVQTWTANKSGKYKIELYGAAGGFPDDLNQYFEVIYPAGQEEIRPAEPSGGCIEGYLNVAAGTTYYLQVGGQGTQSLPGELGGAGWNGGGNGYNGSWGGGGATSMTTTDRGTIENFKNYQTEIVAVAGGSGGIGSNWKDYRSINYTSIAGRCIGFTGEGIGAGFSNPKIHVNAVSNVNGYSFGIGQDAYKRQSNGGFGGGAGAGVYGGFAQSNGVLGGGGGAGTNYKLYSFRGHVNDFAGPGKVVITYVDNIEQHIIVDVGHGGTFNGLSGQIDYKQNFGDQFQLVDPVVNPGYRFLGWQKIDQEQISDIHNPIASGQVMFDDDTVTYRAIWIAPLILNAANTSDGRLQLSLIEDDLFNKQYRIMEQYDNGTTWAFINATDEGFSTKNESGQLQYSGRVQELPIKVGYYTFTCNGASGNALQSYIVGNGGNSYGKYFNDDPKTLYVCIGGTQSQTNRFGVGYNGGGVGGLHSRIDWQGYDDGDGTAGGGATHIAFTNRGVLSSYQNNKQDLLMVAGGGGGLANGNRQGFENSWRSGAGGGQSGEKYGSGIQTPGTQTSGGNRGGSFGQGGTGADGWHNVNAQSAGSGGGGGGYYGGGGGAEPPETGQGGSGYVNTALLKDSYTRIPNPAGIQYRTNGQVQWTYFDQTSTMPQLTDVRYTDRAAPNIPADKGLQYVGSKIQINWMHQEDNGSEVLFKAIQYDADDHQKQLSESDIVRAYAIQGVHHYKYILNSNPSSTINTNNSNGTAISDTKLQIDGQQSVRYFHVAAVDGAGNIGPTLHIMIPSQIQVTYDKNSTEATGVTDPSHIEYGQVGKIQYSNFKWEGHRFVEWNTKPDGTGEVFKENQDAEYFYIVKKYGYGLTLYAQYETLYSLTVDPNKGEWTDVSPDGDIHVRDDMTSPGIDTSATGQTYRDPVSFIMGLGDRKNIFDAIRTGYNFTGWLFNT